jgi:hypothetical protein
MLKEYLKYIQEVKISNKLYHASTDQNLKELDPEKTKSTHLKRLKSYVYATDDKSYAAGFTYKQVKRVGFKYGSVNYGPWTIEIPKKYLYTLNNKCSICEVETKSFKKAYGTKTPEFISKKTVKIINEEKYKTAKECMEKNGVVIKVI